CLKWMALKPACRSTASGPFRSSWCPPTMTPTSSSVRNRTTSWAISSNRSSRPTELVIGLAMRRFQQFEALRKEAADLRQALQDRKIIERAKGLLMKRAGLDEQEAFQRLQKMARDNNLKLAQAAQMVLSADQLFQKTSTIG